MSDLIGVKVIDRNNVLMFEKSVSSKTTVDEFRKILIKENDRLSKYKYRD